MGAGRVQMARRCAHWLAQRSALGRRSGCASCTSIRPKDNLTNKCAARGVTQSARKNLYPIAYAFVAKTRAKRRTALASAAIFVPFAYALMTAPRKTGAVSARNPRSRFE